MNEKLKILYQTVILKHNNSPFHFNRNDQASHIVEANNPLCGDRFYIYFEVVDNKIDNLSFYGNGCIISKAATSVIVEKIEKKSIETGLMICQSFLDGLNSDTAVEESFQAFKAVQHFPGRMPCVTLSVEALQKYLETLKQ